MNVANSFKINFFLENPVIAQLINRIILNSTGVYSSFILLCNKVISYIRNS